MATRTSMAIALAAGLACTAGAMGQMGQSGGPAGGVGGAGAGLPKERDPFAGSPWQGRRVHASLPPTAERAKSRPEIVGITHIRSGKVHVPREIIGARNLTQVGFDNYTDADSAAGLNISYVNAGSYDGSATSLSAYLFPMSSCANTQYTNNAPPCFYNAPYSSAASVPLPTDIVWDEYAGDPGASPAGTMDEPLETLGVFRAVPAIVNTETSGSDRVNTVRFLWFDLSSGCFVDGFLVTYLAPANFAGYFNTTIDLTTATFTVEVPNIGLLMMDWDNFESNQSPNATTGDEGLGHMIAGGQVLGAPGFPTPSQQWVAGSTDFSNWLASDGVTNFNNLADTVCPGGGSTSTYTDVLLSTNLVNWFFTDGDMLGLASDFPRQMELADDPPDPPPAPAGPRDLTDEERAKMVDALLVLEEAFEKAGLLDETLDDVFNPIGQDGPQVPYEDGDETTVRDAINKLWDMLDSNRIRVDPSAGWGGSTVPKPGTDSDVIYVGEDFFAVWCDESKTAVERASAKLRLNSTLANEMVHVFQIFEGEDLKQCDAERDSDCASLFYLCAVIDALTDDMGEPIDDISTLPDECYWLRECLESLGIDTAEEVEALVDELTDLKEGRYEDRKENIFEDHIADETSWGEDYYGEDYEDPIRFPGSDTPDSVYLKLPDGTRRDYLLPPGKTVVRASVGRDVMGKPVLVIVATDALGNLCIYAYTDPDCDGLPNLAPAVVVSFGTPALPIRLYNQFQAHDQLPGDPSGTSFGWTFIDNVSGDIYLTRNDAAGVPCGPIEHIGSDPRIASGGGAFRYIYDMISVSQNSQRMILGSTPTVMNFSDRPTIEIEILPLSLVSIPVPGIQSFAQRLGSANQRGTTVLDPFMAQVTLAGQPSVPVQMFSIGQGVMQLRAQGVPGSAGLVGPLAPIGGPLAPDLFMFQGGGPARFLFQPELGENLFCAEADVNLDGASDRLQISTEPARLHHFSGLASNPSSPVRQYEFQQVMEDNLARGVRSLGPSQALLAGRGGNLPVPMAHLQDSFFDVFYALSIHDLNGDAVSAESAIVRNTQLVGGAYQLEIYGNVGPASVLLETHPVPIVPSTLEITDLDGDLDLDVLVNPFFPEDEAVCYINNGLAQFTPGACSCLADVGSPCGTPDGTVNTDDYICYLGLFASAHPLADVTGPGGCGVPDGNVNSDDYVCYLSLFAAGCE